MSAELDDNLSNRAYKLHSAVELWENSKKASMEAKLKKIEVIFVQFMHQFDFFFSMLVKMN